ncbi:MAG: hypothetical protein K0Q63_2794 [Paenibacillus sp.]|jgi:hypothetical protein|nr:hypothetical protein [Paenibacillus sp.]
MQCLNFLTIVISLLGAYKVTLIEHAMRLAAGQHNCPQTSAHTLRLRNGCHRGYLPHVDCFVIVTVAVELKRCKKAEFSCLPLNKPRHNRYVSETSI